MAHPQLSPLIGGACVDVLAQQADDVQIHLGCARPRIPGRGNVPNGGKMWKQTPIYIDSIYIYRKMWKISEDDKSPTQSLVVRSWHFENR